MRIKHLAISAVTALVATVGINTIAQAGTIRHDRSDLQYRNLANQFSSVGKLSLSGSSGGWLCSGTLLNSTWLVTAAHCLDNVQSGTFSIGGSNYNINGAITHSGWLNTNRNPGAGYDLGLFRLSRPVTNVTAASLFTGSNEDKQIGTYVGFGATGTGLTGYTSGSAGTKRAGQNTIELGSRLGFSDRVLISDFDSPLNAALNLEYNLAPGDSGGGLFINGLLAGVNSFISATDGSVDADYGDISAATRVSSFASWINNILRTTPSSTTTSITSTSSNNFSGLISDELGFDQPENLPEMEIFADNYDNTEVRSLPEPTTILGLLLIGSLLVFYRRRKSDSN